MNETELVKIFKALSVESRLKIVKLIKDQTLCVNAITRKLDISQSAVSQHLAVLKEAGLVNNDRYGSIIHYSINKKRLEQFREGIKENFGEDFL